MQDVKRGYYDRKIAEEEYGVLMWKMMERLTPKERHNDAHLSALNSKSTTKMPTTHNKSRIRWLPAAIILALTVLAVILIWSIDAPHRQSRVFQTVSTLDAFVPADAAVAALFLTAAVESPATCVWGGCSDPFSFQLLCFG